MPYQEGSVQPPFACESDGTPRQNGLPGQSGRVYLVGAGPGDPGLLTIRGRECLEIADFVLYDGLANSQLLDFAQRAECISVGKHGQIPIWTQTDINAKMVELARAGHCVVRLKGGDPAVFARTAEELDVLSQAKIPFEVVPGITAALAAASYVGIPITHRSHASAVALITGQQQSAERPQTIDWDALARFPGTLVFYMGVTTVGQWTSNLIEAGKSASTPAAIVRRCTWSDQTVIRSSLGDVAKQLTPASNFRPPVIVIIGDVAALGSNFDWFTSRPLQGCGVLITRASHQADSLSTQLRSLGAQVFHQPVFEVEPPPESAAAQQVLDDLAARRFQGVTFSSSNGVDGLMQLLKQQRIDSRAFAGMRIATVGKATAERLEAYGLIADVVAGSADSGIAAEQSAAGLLAMLGESVRGQRWLVTTTNRSKPTLPEGLAEQGADISECLAYTTREITELLPSVAAALQNGRIHYATATSSFVAEASFKLLAPFRAEVQPVCLSAATADKLEQLGWPAAATAQDHSASSLFESIIHLWKAR